MVRGATQDLIYGWEEAAGFDRPLSPRLPDPETYSFREALIREEVEELHEAIEDEDLVEVADALADIVWVTYAAARAFGIDLDEVIREVWISNQTKFDGGIERDEKGKIQKGGEYEPPWIRQALESQGWGGPE